MRQFELHGPSILVFCVLDASKFSLPVPLGDSRAFLTVIFSNLADERFEAWAGPPVSSSGGTTLVAPFQGGLHPEEL
jgi:hypothetical protein